MFGIGAGEFVLILVVGLIVFGPSKLPEFGRSLGKLIRELKKTQATLSNAINLDEPPSPAAAAATPPSSTTVTATSSSTSNEVQEKPQQPAQSAASATTSTTVSTAVTSTEQLTQLANSNPIRLDKTDSTNSDGTIPPKERA